MRKWRYHLIFGLLCVGFLCSLCACGLSDWSYELLPGEYEIWRINSQDIVLVRQNEEGVTAVVQTFVYAFCYNQRFIGIHGLDTGSDHVTEGMDIRETYIDSPEYFLVDTQTHEVYGPMTLETYEKLVLSFHAAYMGEWITTRPAPVDSVN